MCPTRIPTVTVASPLKISHSPLLQPKGYNRKVTLTDLSRRKFSINKKAWESHTQREMIQEQGCRRPKAGWCSAPARSVCAQQPGRLTQPPGEGSAVLSTLRSGNALLAEYKSIRLSGLSACCTKSVCTKSVCHFLAHVQIRHKSYHDHNFKQDTCAQTRLPVHAIWEQKSLDAAHTQHWSDTMYMACVCHSWWRWSRIDGNGFLQAEQSGCYAISEPSAYFCYWKWLTSVSKSVSID